MEPPMLYSKFKLAVSALFISIALIVVQGVLVEFIPIALAQGTTIYTYFTAQNLSSSDKINHTRSIATPPATPCSQPRTRFPQSAV
jgi:hypothetical protein